MQRKMKIILRVLTIFILTSNFLVMSFATTMQRLTHTPLGLWETYDNDTGKPDSIVKIWCIRDIYYGKVVKIFPQHGHRATDRCVKCQGEQHNQPILGMTILWGMRHRAHDYGEGSVLDPNSGNIYHAEMQLQKNGNELALRGYVGIPLFGRTTTWYRYSR